MFGRKNYVIEILNDNGGIIKVVLRNETKKEIKKQIDYYKSKSYWYEEIGNLLITKTNQPV